MDYDKALEILSCPVCHDLSKPPIYQCKNGHVICMFCHKKLKDDSCPTCRVPINKSEPIRALGLEQVIYQADVTCRNRKKGCPDSIHIGDWKLHKAVCRFEEKDICSQLGSSCTTKVALAEFNKHCLSKHTKQTQKLFSSKGKLSSRIVQSIAPKDISVREGGVETIQWEPCFLLSVGFSQDTCNGIYVVIPTFDAVTRNFKWVVKQIEGGRKMVEVTVRDSSYDESYSFKWSGFCSILNSYNLRDQFELPIQSLFGNYWEIEMEGKAELQLEIEVDVIEYSAPKPTTETFKFGISPALDALPSSSQNINKKLPNYSFNTEKSSEKFVLPPLRNFKDKSLLPKLNCGEYRKVKSSEFNQYVVYGNCSCCEVFIRGPAFKCAECSTKVCYDCGNSGEHSEHILVLQRSRFKSDGIMATDVGANASSLDNADENSHHIGTQCWGCGMAPIIGVLCRCCECKNVNICSSCVEKGIHKFHLLCRIAKPREMSEIDKIVSEFLAVQKQ